MHGTDDATQQPTSQTIIIIIIMENALKLILYWIENPFPFPQNNNKNNKNFKNT